MEGKFAVEQIKESVKADYHLKALEGKTDGEALMLLLEELAMVFASTTSFMSQIEDLKKENKARKIELIAIGEEQQKIHKFYKDQFSKNSGWRWWQ
tara:strand:+ start:668 stop:955 length:288 start_codon:yes stop_codon:yes gene_type:complete